jgi:hypothetical protein
MVRVDHFRAVDSASLAGWLLDYARCVSSGILVARLYLLQDFAKFCNSTHDVVACCPSARRGIVDVRRATKFYIKIQDLVSDMWFLPLLHVTSVLRDILSYCGCFLEITCW